MKRNVKDHRWRTFFRRLLIAGMLAFVIAILPLPVWTPKWFVYWQVPVVVFLFICFVGKLLIDAILYRP